MDRGRMLLGRPWPMKSIVAGQRSGHNSQCLGHPAAGIPPRATGRTTPGVEITAREFRGLRLRIRPATADTASGRATVPNRAMARTTGHTAGLRRITAVETTTVRARATTVRNRATAAAVLAARRPITVVVVDRTAVPLQVMTEDLRSDRCL